MKTPVPSLLRGAVLGCLSVLALSCAGDEESPAPDEMNDAGTPSDQRDSGNADDDTSGDDADDDTDSDDDDTAADDDTNDMLDAGEPTGDDDTNPPDPPIGDASAPGPSSDAGEEQPSMDSGFPEPEIDASSSRALTVHQRAALEAQVLYELEQMGLVASTAKSTAEEHTLIIRLPFPWSFFTNDMTCVVDDVYPEGCRSGSSDFNPSFGFQTIEPTANYAYEWAGEVGSYEGSASFVLEGTPVYFLDTNDIEPNDDALIVMRAHTEAVEITEAAAEAFLFEREAEKDFDIIREGEPVRLHHTDSTSLWAVPIPSLGGADVQAIEYEATFDELADEEVSVFAEVDEDGLVQGTVAMGDEELATFDGAPFAEPSVPLAFVWHRDLASHDDSGCEPSCDSRVCGREPTCGESCGTCGAGEQCSPLGECTELP